MSVPHDDDNDDHDDDEEGVEGTTFFNAFRLKGGHSDSALVKLICMFV